MNSRWTRRSSTKLGKTFQPGVITKVVLAASELMKGKKLISMTGGMYDVPSMPVAEVKKVFEEAPHEVWTEMLQYGSTTGMMNLRIELSKFMAEADIKSDPGGEPPIWVLLIGGEDNSARELKRAH